MRPQALTRKNVLFAGHDDGTENWAVLASLIETAKLNSIDPKPVSPMSSTAWSVSGRKLASTSFCLGPGRNSAPHVTPLLDKSSHRKRVTNAPLT